MIEPGHVVRKIDETKIEVALSSGGCGGCKGCIVGAASCVERTVIVENRFNHKIGDSVELELPSGHFYKSFFYLFLQPLFGLIFTIMFLQTIGIGEAMALLIALFVFLGLYYFAYRYDQKIKDETVYKIIK